MLGPTLQTASGVISTAASPDVVGTSYDTAPPIEMNRKLTKSREDVSVLCEKGRRTRTDRTFDALGPFPDS